MAGIVKPQGTFTITPHKVSVCILLQTFAPPPQSSEPFPFSSIAQHNALGVFLTAITKSCEDILEPKLNDLIAQLREISGQLDDWLSDHLTSRLSLLSSPDDLFTFFSDLRGILGGPDSNVVDDDQTILDPNSSHGIFLRRCLLAFNLLSFEAVCHLLTNIATYGRDAVSGCPYESSHLDGSSSDLEPSEYESMDLENFVFEKVSEENQERKMGRGGLSFHTHAPKALVELVEDFEVSAGSKFKHRDKPREGSPFTQPPNDTLSIPNSSIPNSGGFLRSSTQIHGYLLEQADAVEKKGCSFPFKGFEVILKQIEKLAPELHRVHFLRYLNFLYHDDYPAALENLHRYFDYSAGVEGSDYDPSSAGQNRFGRYEAAALCLGMMHFHFGHPTQALEVLTEAVRVSQQNSDDTCLAYTLAAICNLLAEVGITATGRSGILGTPLSPGTSMGTSLSIQQQLFVLLRRSLKRAETLNLKRLVASNRIALAKFDLTHVQRHLHSFGPKASTKLTTLPSNVCKELRLSSHVISEFSSESSTMIVDGAFSTVWLKNLQKPMGSLVFSQENAPERKSDAFHFCAQPSSIPGSVLQLVSSSYLVRATAWEMYGRYLKVYST